MTDSRKYPLVNAISFSGERRRSRSDLRHQQEKLIGPLCRLRRVVNSARGHQQQEQRAIALVFGF
jgi:hypothetical protein